MSAESSNISLSWMLNLDSGLAIINKMREICEIVVYRYDNYTFKI